ncbi:MAG: DUF58 domain-containing protein [Oscillospiraceae bacterium]|nr:DUF58 domain-containing protein [Oscillospiraceae bacterium]
MARNRVIYILTVLACFGFSMAYTGKVSQILLFTVLLYPAAAFVLAVVQLIFAKAEFCERYVAAPKDLSFNLMIRVKNRFIFPAVPIELMCGLPDGDIGLFADKRLFVSLPAFGSADVAVRCRHRFRGSFCSEIKRIYIVDPLRIIRVSKKCEKAMPMLFLPRKLMLEELLFRTAVEQSFAQKRLNSADKEDFSHVREYRDGDVLQMVHWKLTAKQDELMIKQFDSINDLRAVILCDYHQSNDIEGMTRADMVIETALAFAKTALDKGIHSTVDIGDFNTNPSFVNDAASFNKFYDLVSGIPAELHTNDLIAMTDALDKSSAALLVLITTEISDELLDRVRDAAQQVTVFYVYLNLSQSPVDQDFKNERFLFLNVLGTDDDALNNAAAQILENAGERL